MRIDLGEAFREAIEAKRGEWTEEEVALGLRLSVRYAALLARQQAGEDVAEDLGHAEAGLRSLAAATAASGAQVVNQVVDRVIGVLTKAIVGAAV